MQTDLASALRYANYSNIPVASALRYANPNLDAFSVRPQGQYLDIYQDGGDVSGYMVLRRKKREPAVKARS